MPRQLKMESSCHECAAGGLTESQIVKRFIDELTTVKRDPLLAGGDLEGWLMLHTDTHTGHNPSVTLSLREVGG